MIHSRFGRSSVDTGSKASARSLTAPWFGAPITGLATGGLVARVAWLACLTIGVGIFGGEGVAVGQARSPGTDEFQDPKVLSESVENEIAGLIERLGDESFLVRRDAVARLKRKGLEAFDQLHAAQFHPDLEIELAARYLVGSLMVSWSKQDDPKEVREALDSYGSQNEIERRSRIEILAGLPDRIGIEALLRLTRFETSLSLSQVAALAIMNQPVPRDGKSNTLVAEMIRTQLAGNDRDGSVWLRLYADDLESGEYSAERWRGLIDRQRLAIDTLSSNVISRTSVLSLVRICASLAVRLDRREEAIDLATEHLDLVTPTTSAMIESATWAIDHQLHPVVLALKNRFGLFFDGQPLLLYAAAESMAASGNHVQAEKLAAEASKYPELPDEDAKETWSPKQIENAFQERRNIAKKLHDRGLFRWAEKEYRQIIDYADIDQDASVSTRQSLAMMLIEARRHADVVEVLQPLVDRIERDDELKQRLVQDGLYLKQIFSDLHFCKAEVAIEADDLESGRELLSKAYSINPTNIDILIRMYRTDGDEPWRQRVMTLLGRATNQSSDHIERQLRLARQVGPINNRELAGAYNEYAWLVSNTEGDFELALRYSLASLKINVDGAKLDTCARCYFALGRFDQAIATQKRAIKRMPYSPPLLRQLAEFESARADAIEESRADAIEETRADANGENGANSTERDTPATDRSP